MKTWHRVVAGLGGIVLLSVIGLLWWLHAAHPPSDPASHDMKPLDLNGTIIQAEVVRSDADLQEGLSDRSFMAMDHGMLFEMGYRDRFAFWMNRMHFPLDIIWIDGNKVVEIAPDLPAPGLLTVPVTHSPTVDADRILEVNAGVAARANLKVGDVIGGLY
ncbi:MAG TPA: DUF192 domain-containing protein [Verrucomicrobiae bacterium]|nr:DUF192 domain-containing protein [Verrucomicrobiae bacterium]